MKELVILMIEDDPVDILMVQKIMVSMDTRVRLVTTDNCIKALELLSTDLAAVDLIILLDINIPQMDGIEFLDEMRKQPENRMVPVVVMSTSEDVFDVQKCYEAGVSGYMVKPFEFDAIKILIETIIHYWTFSLLPCRTRFDPELRYKRKRSEPR